VIKPNPEENAYNENAEFEQVIENSIDVVKVINMLKSADQKMIIVYKAKGYTEWEIADVLGISERTVRRYVRELRELFPEKEKKGKKVS